MDTKKQTWLKNLACRAYAGPPEDWDYASNRTGSMPCSLAFCTNTGYRQKILVWADCGGFGVKPKAKRLKFELPECCWNSNYSRLQAMYLAEVITEVLQEAGIDAKVQVFKMKPHRDRTEGHYAVSVNGLQDYPWNL